MHCIYVDGTDFYSGIAFRRLSSPNCEIRTKVAQCSVLWIFLVGQLLKRHHRHGGGAAEQVAQSQVEQEGCAVVVQPPRLPDHQHRQSVAKGAWDKHGLVKLTRRS